MPAAASLFANVKVRSNCSRDSWLAATNPCSPRAPSSCSSPSASASGRPASACRIPVSTPTSVAERAQSPCVSGTWGIDGTKVSQTARNTSSCSSVG